MKKRVQMVSGVILLTLFGLYVFNKPHVLTNIKKKHSETLKNTTARAPNNTGPKPQLTERSISSITKGELKSFRESFPDKNDVKAEAGQNPHGTPISLIRFAKKLGTLSEKALQNSDDATRLADELGVCALDDTIAQSSRALCLSNIERLGEIYPHLQEKAAKTRELVSSEVIMLHESKELLIRQ